MPTLVTTTTQHVTADVKVDVDFAAFKVRTDVKAILIESGGVLDGVTFQPNTYAVATDAGFVEVPRQLFEAIYSPA